MARVANSALRITDINFEGIKDNLKTYLASQDELKDYDYESSTIQTILNLLAYNTYYNAFYLNMVGNEMFLDSAQLRDSVVSRAKQIGYTPRSARGATATVNIRVTPPDSPSTVVVSEGTAFQTSIDNVSYTFTTLDSFPLTPNEAGTVFSGSVDITEGEPVQESYTVNSNNPVRYFLNNENADTNTLTVNIQESASNTAITEYTLASDFTNITATNAVYFLSEDREGKYEVYFGDGIIGKQPRNGNIIRLNYNVVNGSIVNNANNFSGVGLIDGYDNYTVSLVSRAQGGSEQESINSIKLNAPNEYTLQNRAVTANDFKTLVLNNFGDISSVSVWGGDENQPPIFGKVFIAAKPTSGLLLSETRKNDIVSFLETKKILTIEPIVVDATYLFVEPTVTVKFNPDNTGLKSGQLAENVKDAILDYESTELGLFGEDFVTSELITKTLGVNGSITSSEVEIELQRRFVPEVGIARSYTIPFNHELLDISSGVVLPIIPEAHPGQGLTLSSSRFTFNGVTVEMDDDGFGNIRLYRLRTDGVKVYESRRAGTIDYGTGLVSLRDINITAFEGDYIYINVVPNVVDITPVRNQLILLTEARVNVIDTKLGKTTSILSNIRTEGDTTEITDYGTNYTLF